MAMHDGSGVGAWVDARQHGGEGRRADDSRPTGQLLLMVSSHSLALQGVEGACDITGLPRHYGFPPSRSSWLLFFLPSDARAQTDPASPRVRAQQVLTTTKSGHEGDVPCDALEGLGQPLIELGKEAGGRSLDRAAIAFRLAERAGRCAGSEPLLAAALTELSATLLGAGSLDASLAAAKESVELFGRLNDRNRLGIGLERARQRALVA
jgi:hypothetical protein